LGEKNTSRKNPFTLSPPELSSNARAMESGNCMKTETKANTGGIEQSRKKIGSVNKKTKLSNPTKTWLRGPLVS